MAELSTSDPLKDDFIFEYGDVAIKFKLNEETIAIGKVSSAAMAMASPVWKKFIYPPFPQIQSEKAVDIPPVKKLDFTEDDSTALLILLRVAHLRFKQVPASPSYQVLVNLAVLCDQYDCVGVVRPWFHTWFWNEESESLKDGQEKWLFIAWVFGREHTFENLAIKMVKETSIPANGKDPMAQTWVKEIMALPFPKDLIDIIFKARLSTVEELLEIPYSRIARYEMSKTAFCKQPKPEHCDMFSYGALLKRLQEAGLWPRPQARDVKTSVRELASTIEKFTIPTLSGHAECFGNDEMKVCASASALIFESPLLDSQRERLRAQNHDGH